MANTGHDLDFPLVDFHVHVGEGLSPEGAVALSQQRRVKFGLVAHAGRGREIGDDGALNRYVEDLEKYPVYKGIQAEGADWMACFSQAAVARLDYVLSDAMTFPDAGGRQAHLWQPEEVEIVDKQDFMDRYVAFNVTVLSEWALDIMASPTFLPACIVDEYDALWTGERMDRVIEAAAQHNVALEIGARYRIPSAAFIKRARQAGVGFSFGTNSHGEEAGRLDYCLEMVRACGLKRKNMFVP